MRRTSIVLVGACVLVAAVYLLFSTGGGSGGRGGRRASGTAEEPAALPGRPSPATPAKVPAPDAPPWRAVGAARGAARGTVDVLLAFDYDERVIARGGFSDGAFAIELPSLGDLSPILLSRAKLVARCDAPGFLPARSAEVALADREPGDVRLDLALEAGGCVRGRVVDDVGTPVEDADVWFSPRDVRASAFTDAEGRFVLPVHKAAGHWISARKNDVGVGVWGPFQLSPLSDFAAGDLVLRGPSLLRGVAVYPDGTPARRLGLCAAPAALREKQISSWPVGPFDASTAEPPEGLTWGLTRTDEEGRFLIRGLEPGSYFFLEDKARELFEAGGEVRVVVDLYRILVQVVDERGQPAPLYASARSDSGSTAAGKIDDLTVRPGERWTVTIGDPDLVPAAVVVDIAKEKHEYEVTLVARTPSEFGRAQVTLLDPRGTPFPAVRVGLYALPGGNMIQIERPTDDQGLTSEVPAGRYRLEVTPWNQLAPYFPAVTEVDLRPGEPTLVRLTARPGGRVQLTFKREGGADGEQLSQVLVEARPLRGGDPVRLLPLLVRDDGGYLLSVGWKLGERASGWQLLEPGPYEIHMRAQGYLPIVVPALVRPEQVTAIDAVLEPEDR